MTQKNKAVTLIELLIVIAIIGILSAIAIPSYQRYIIKTRVAEMAVLFKDCELAVAKYFLDNNSFPNQVGCWGGITNGGSNPPDGFGGGSYELGTTAGGFPKMRINLSNPSVPSNSGSSNGTLWFGMAYDDTTGSLVTACGTNNSSNDISDSNLPNDCKDNIATAIWGL